MYIWRLLFTVLFLCGWGIHAQNKVILLSMDGFRHDYIEVAKRGQIDVSNFERIIKKGIRAEVQNVMITNTFPTHFAIATGRYVENHGLVGNSFYDPNFNDTYSYRDAYDQIEAKWLNYNNNEPIWLTSQRQANRSCVFYWPGSNAEFYGKYPFATYGLYNNAPNFRYRVDRVISWIKRDEFSFCAFYFPEPDSTGHKFGPDSSQMLQKLGELNQEIGYLLDQIELTPELNGKVNLIVTSDHGMAQIPPNHIIPMFNKVANGTYIGNISPAVVGLWPKEGQKTVDELYAALTEAQPLKNLTVYRKENLPEYYHYSQSYRIPPLIALADIPYLIAAYPNDYTDPTNPPPNGMHGYDNQNPLMHPIFMAFGPDIKQLPGIQSLRQIDIYPLICGLLKLQKPNKIDGQLARVISYLNEAPTATFMETFELYRSGILSDL